MAGFSDKDLSVLPAAVISTMITSTTNSINLRMQGALPETLEQVEINGISCQRTTLEYLNELLLALYRAQSIQASSNGGLNIARAVRRGSGDARRGRGRFL